AASLAFTVLLVLWLRRGDLSDVHATIVAPVAGPSGAPTHYFAFLASGAVWISFAFFLVTTMAFGILQNYAPAILSHVYGVSLVLANGGLEGYLLRNGGGRLTWGALDA